MQNGSGGGGALIFLLPIALIAFMFFSQRRRQKATAQRQQGVQVGDEVTTTSGMLARVVALEDSVVTLEAAPGVHLRFDRRAISRITPPVAVPMDDATDLGDDGPSAPPTPPIDR